MTEEITQKPRRARDNNPKDWVTSFDRDLIRAARDGLVVSFESMDDDTMFTCKVIQVDKDFIKVRIDDADVWFNKAHLCRVKVGNPDA